MPIKLNDKLVNKTKKEANWKLIIYEYNAQLGSYL